MENSVEIFNCPLCSFCETGLDRLVKHIRQHIKPEPRDSSAIPHGQTETVGYQPITPRDHPETNQKELHLDDYINNLSSKETPTTISLFAGPDSSVEVTSAVTTSSSDTPVWPNIKVINPQSVAQTTEQRSAVSSKNQQSAVTEITPSNQTNTEVPPQPQQMQISPPALPPPHSVMYMRKETSKYVQIHPRDQFNQKAPYPHQQYVNKQFVHGDQYVPIAPAKVNNFQDGKPMQLEMHEVYRRGAPGPKHHQNVQFVSSPHPRNMVPMNGRPSPPEMHSTYPVRPNFRPPPQQQQFPVHSPPQGGNVHHQRQTAQVQYQQQQRGPGMDPQLQSRVHSRISGMQNIELPNVGFPNNGTVLLNPEQLLKMSGNTTPMDQLAGLLVVPLKKTAEIAVQTDPVEFDNSAKLSKENNITCGVQTDLRMQYISEEPQRATVPVFDSIRSTDTLFECLICGEEFVSDQHLQDHVSTMHKHVCENCFHASTSLSEHTSHVTECGKCDAELLCMDCNNSFPSIKKLNQHRIKVHSVRMPFRCGICNMPFETHDAVMQHMATHDNDVPEFKCRYCRKVFQSADALSKHFQRHKQVDVEYQCRFCRKSFNTDKLLRDHIGIAHVIKEFDDNDDIDGPLYSSNGHSNHTPTATRVTVSQNLNRKYFLCRYCDLAFKNKDLLSRHVNICSKNGSCDVTCFVCDVCKEFFDSDNSRKMHLKNDHRRQNGYRCPKCSKVYRTWTRLKFHTKQQHLKKNCPDCNTVFTKEHVLRKHQEDVHGKTSGQNGERVYKCSDCNLSLYTLTDLTVHRRTLHPERKSMKTADQSSGATMLSFIDNRENEPNDAVDDSTINDQLTEFSSIQQSTNETTNSDPALTCDRCNASFTDDKRLKNHLGLTHGERPFVCHICNKRFQYSSQIVWHMKNHNNRPSNAIAKTSSKLWKSKTTLSSKFKPKTSSMSSSNFICQFCGARFKQEKLLKNHKGAVHKIKLFSCHICAMKFGHSTELIWHIRTCKSKFMRENPGTALPENTEVTSSQSPKNDELNGTEEDNGDISTFKSPLGSPTNDLSEDIDMPAVNIQLSKEEAEELLQNDPEFDHARGEYTCPLCKKSTKSITGMKTHYGRVHGIWGKESSHKYAGGRKVTIWPCRNCDQEFQSFEEIRSHCLELHGLTVTKEELDFETRQEFVPEENLTKTSLYTCQTCGVSFDNSKSIRVHTFKKHGILLNDTSLKESENNSDLHGVPQASLKPKIETLSNPDDITEDELRYKCPRCKSQFRTTKALRVHSFKRHGVILSKQEMNRSKKWVATNVSSHDYTTTVHNPNKGRDLIESPNPCDRCGRVFGNYRALFTHYRQAHRITDPNHVFVPRKPSRTELSIQNFPAEASSSADPPIATTPPISTKQSPGVADSVDCPKCARTFTNHKSFVAHLYSAHKVSKDQYSIYWPNGIPILPRESSACPTCNKECLDERAMRIHMFKAHGTHYRDYAQDQESNKSSLASPDDMVTMVNHSSFNGTPDDSKNVGSTCYVCNQTCKSRRALITHEFNFHNIRWENGKRVFPEEVKPTMSYQEDSLNGGSATMVNERGDSKWDSKRNSSTSTTSTPPSSKPFVCSLCDASYHNRRAITTHLCRVHKYRKDDVQAYFAQHFATDESPTMSPFVDSSDVNNVAESNGVNDHDEIEETAVPNDTIGDDIKDDMLDNETITEDTAEPSEALVIDEDKVNTDEDVVMKEDVDKIDDLDTGSVLPEKQNIDLNNGIVAIDASA